MKIGANVDQLDLFTISGSKVLERIGTYMVIAVGTHSGYGKAMMSLVEDNEPTPLQQKLTVVADEIVITGISAAVLLFVTLSLESFILLPHNTDSPSEKGQTVCVL
jgi:P-type Ca2+ transporter type 2C